MKLCDKCCECVRRISDWQWVCSITGVAIEDVDRDWDEGQNPTEVCDTYRGPIGFDFDKWADDFSNAFAKEVESAIKDGRVRPSEVVRALWG